VDDAAVIMGLTALTALTAGYLQSPAGQKALNQIAHDIEALIEAIRESSDASDWQKKADIESWPWWQENVGPMESSCEKPPDEKERCHQVWNECRAECSKILPTRRLSQGNPFHNCGNKCLEDNDCLGKL
jgi:hypothetical protein